MKQCHSCQRKALLVDANLSLTVEAITIPEASRLMPLCPACVRLLVAGVRRVLESNMQLAPAPERKE